MENIKTEKEKRLDKIISYIEWQIDKTEFKKGYKLKGIFQFCDEKNEVIYYKAKFIKPDGKKASSYYHFEGDKITNSRGVQEIPYNLYNTLNAIEKDNIIILVEGEKDANTINSLLKNTDYVATSVKGCTNLEILKRKNIRVYVLGDTGEAGDKYKRFIFKHLNLCARQFKFIKLPGLESMGDNKDVTDWIEAGHTKKDLLNAFKRSLDIKNKHELQQDSNGIYKTVYSKREDQDIKIYLTNFKIISATRILFVNDELEGVKLTFKSQTGAVIEKMGLSTVFDDTKTFKNFLGTLDLGFKGKVDDLTDLKSWINKYFALEIQEVHAGVKFLNKDGQITFIENNGSISKKGIDVNIKSDGRNNADVLEIEPITKEELKELKNYILEFAPYEKALSIIGTIINNLAVYQAEQLNVNLHYLLIVGESGSGKSTILENVIAPILNYPRKDIRSIGLITTFALIKILSDGNYPAIFDEFKPSSLDRYKILSLSEIFRNLYNKETISKGNKNLKVKDFNLARPIIMAGEESYPNQEKPLIERSCIVYLSKTERTKEHTKNINWLIENKKVLRKFGRSLIEIILSLSVEDYKDIREKAKKNVKDLSNRPLRTAVNICSGILILNILLKKHGIKEIPKGYEDLIVKNIKEEIMDDGKETHSIVERMLILYNNMIEDGRATYSENVVKYKNDGVFIKTSEMISQIYEYSVRFGADLIPLKLKDFRKQAQKSGYLESVSSKVIRINEKTAKFDTYSIDRLRELKVDSIVPPELKEINDGQDIPF